MFTFSSAQPLKQMKGVNLSCVRTCMVVAEERPRIALTQSFSKLFKDLGLSARAVSTTFGCRVNVAICLQVRLYCASYNQVALIRKLCRKSHQLYVEYVFFLLNFTSDFYATISQFAFLQNQQKEFRSFFCMIRVRDFEYLTGSLLCSD